MRLLYIVTKIKLWHNILYLPIDFMNKMWYHIKAPTRYAKRKIGTALQGVVLPILMGFSSYCAKVLLSLRAPIFHDRRRRSQAFAEDFWRAIELGLLIFCCVENLGWDTALAVHKKHLYLHRICTDGQVNQPDFAWAILFTLFTENRRSKCRFLRLSSRESSHEIWMFEVFNITCSFWKNGSSHAQISWFSGDFESFYCCPKNFFKKFADVINIKKYKKGD